MHFPVVNFEFTHSEDDHEALICLDLVHRHYKTVSEHDFRVYLNTMTQYTNIKLLSLIPIRLYLSVLVSDLSNHATLESTPGAHLGIPAYQGTHHH